MGDLFQPWHLAILAVIAVLLFGGKKLPELGKGLGEGWRGFKEGISGLGDDVKKTTDAAKTVDSANTVTPKPGDDVKPPTA